MIANRPLALITGASAGIGEALAYEFARGGYDLAIVARSPLRLAKVAEKAEALGARVHLFPLDLTADGSGAALEEQVARRKLVVDVLVNNAGIGFAGAFTDVTLEEQLSVVDVDVRVVTELTRRFLPGMIRRGDAGILNVSSTAAYQPGPYMATYYASKAYVLSLTEALNRELRGTGVHATALCPGPVRTGFHEIARFDRTIRLITWLPLATPADVARSGYRGFQKRRREVIPGLIPWVLAKSAAFMPRPLMLLIVEMLQKSRMGGATAPVETLRPKVS